MLKKTPRCKGISTSDLLDRILERGKSIHEKKFIPTVRTRSMSDLSHTTENKEESNE
jgi:hypothetical protein